MNIKVASAFAELSLKDNRFLQGLGRMQAALGRFASFGARVVAPLTAALGGAGLIAGAGLGLKLAGEMEQAEVAFTTMTGSADAALALLKEIEQFAAATPFQFPEIVQAGKSLLAFGFAANRIKPTLKTLGDLSAGLNIPIGELAEIYGKARVQGRLFMEDINQLTGRGIPIVTELAKQFGVAESEIREMVSGGKVHFRDLEKAFARMTGAGGQFEGLMEALSKTLLGKWSTFKDNIAAVMRSIGKTLEQQFDLKGVLDRLSAALPRVQTVAVGVIRYMAAVGRMVWGIIQRVVEAIGNVVKAARQWLDQNRRIVAAVAGLAATVAVVGAIMVGFKLLASTIMVATGAVAVLGKAIVLLATSPFAVLLAAIGGVVAGFAFLLGKGETVAERIGDGFMRLAGFLDVVFGDVKNMAATWNRAMDAIGEALVEGWIRSTSFIKIAWTNALAGMDIGWRKLVAMLLGVWQSFAEKMKPATRWLAEKMTWIWGRIQGLSNEEIQTHIDVMMTDNLDEEIGRLGKLKKNLDDAATAAAGKRDHDLQKIATDEQERLAELKKIREQRDAELTNKLANTSSTLSDKVKQLADDLKKRFGLGAWSKALEEIAAQMPKAPEMPDADTTTSESGKGDGKGTFVGIADLWKRMQEQLLANRTQEKVAENTERTAKAVEAIAANAAAFAGGLLGSTFRPFGPVSGAVQAVGDAQATAGARGTNKAQDQTAKATVKTAGATGKMVGLLESINQKIGGGAVYAP